LFFSDGKGYILMFLFWFIWYKVVAVCRYLNCHLFNEHTWSEPVPYHSIYVGKDWYDDSEVTMNAQTHNCKYCGETQLRIKIRVTRKGVPTYEWSEWF